jgi:amino acid adenylation domain-containing protein
MNRTVEMVVSLLAIMKAGGAYVPIDPNYPKDRQEFMIKDAGVETIVTNEEIMSSLEGLAGRIINVEGEREAIGEMAVENPGMEIGSQELAYVLFTSGSTGKPKGVEIEHRSVAALVGWAQEVYERKELEGVLFSTSISFDLSVYELFVTLSLGGRVILAENALELPEMENRDEVRLINTVPSAITELLQTGSIPETVRIVNLAGEPLRAELVDRLYEMGTIEKVNDLYGPSEDTTYSTRALREKGGREVIGRPISNTKAYVLDEGQRPVPVGVPGELYLGGDGLARGYLNRPELTAEKFVPDPFADGAGGRLYRTGDLVRYRADGNLEFIGRIDHQVKVRGFRIELREIELVLNKHPEVSESVVVAREDTPGVQQLVGYIVPEDVSAQDDREPKVIDSPEASHLIIRLREHLDKTLPAYMVPNAFVIMEMLPLTPNAKIDRKALPSPERRHLQVSTVFIAPQTPVEIIIADIWSSVLGTSEIGIYDNFFELGGHSLLATKVLARARRAFDLDIPLRSLFDSPTVAKFAERIENIRRAEIGLSVTKIKPVPRDEDLLLSFGQQRLWFIDQLDPDSPVYNIPEAIKINGDLDIKILEDSINEIIRRHEVMRSSYPTVEGKPIVVIEPEIKISLDVIDFSSFSVEEREIEIQRFVISESRKTFDIANAPLFRLNVLNVDHNEWIVVLIVHHIISDGWSSDVFYKELGILYSLLSEGKKLEVARRMLPTLECQYIDYAAWQRDWLSGEVLNIQLEYWKEQLADLPPLLELPIDHPRKALQSSVGEHISVKYPYDLYRKATEFCKREGVTLFMLLLAAFQTLLYRYSGQSDIAVGTPIANRTRREIEGLVGFFVNTLVMRTDFSENPNFYDLVQQVREVSLGAFSHQDLPFEILVDSLQLEKDLSHTPLFQVMFMMQNAAEGTFEIPGLEFNRLDIDSGMSMFDLTLVITESQDGFLAGIEYSTELFNRNTIQQMLDHFEVLLESALDQPDLYVAKIPILKSGEYQKILYEWNQTKFTHSVDRCIHHLVEAQVMNDPDKTAVISGDSEITYEKMNARANQLARYLRASGVGAENIVGVAMYRSVEMLIAMLAILKSGAAYIPLDPAYPKERLEYIVQDAKVSLILTNGDLDREFDGLRVQTLPIEARSEVIDKENADNLDDVFISNRNLAYVIYTSGSTGMPKGVMVEHQSMVNHNLSVIKDFKLTSDDRMLQFATINFDTAVEEIFPTLIVGGTLIMRDEEMLLSLDELLWLIENYQISILDLPTAYWHEWVHEMSTMGKRVPSDLRMVVIGGEKCLKARYEDWLAVNDQDCEFLNTYGPTEATVIASLYQPDDVTCLLYTSPSPRDRQKSRMPSSA